MVYERAIALELDMNICHPGVCASFHTQVVNRKLGPVDFCPPFITLLMVKVISLLQQWAYRPDHYCARTHCCSRWSIQFLDRGKPGGARG